MSSVNWSNVTDLAQLPAQANNVSGGSFWTGMLYMMWIILIFMMIGYGFEVAIITASFLALILGIMLVYSGLVAWQWVLTFVGVLLSMFLYIMWSSSKRQ